MLSKSRSNHEAWIFTGPKLFLIGKTVLIVMVPIFMNKDVFEPSCNNLKSTVQNHNFFCTKLILITQFSSHYQAVINYVSKIHIETCSEFLKGKAGL